MRKAKVEYSLARTLNMGNYESTKIHIGFAVECEATKEAVEKAFEGCRAFVKRKIAKEEMEYKVGDPYEE